MIYMTREQIVTDKQLHALDKFIAKVLDAYKDGAISRADAVWDIGHVLVAIDQGNAAEFVNYPANWPNKG
jgi:CubicO group peptidase (beta-lactamase class C family)